MNRRTLLKIIPAGMLALIPGFRLAEAADSHIENHIGATYRLFPETTQTRRLLPIRTTTMTLEPVQGLGWVETTGSGMLFHDTSQNGSGTLAIYQMELQVERARKNRLRYQKAKYGPAPTEDIWPTKENFWSVPHWSDLRFAMNPAIVRQGAGYEITSRRIIVRDNGLIAHSEFQDFRWDWSREDWVTNLGWQ